MTIPQGPNPQSKTQRHKPRPPTKVKEHHLVILGNVGGVHILDQVEAEVHLTVPFANFTGMEEPLQIEPYDTEIDLIDLG
jgi:hypothetical protein